MVRYDLCPNLIIITSSFNIKILQLSRTNLFTLIKCYIYNHEIFSISKNPFNIKISQEQILFALIKCYITNVFVSLKVEWIL